jgi:hypothetical protein
MTNDKLADEIAAYRRRYKGDMLVSVPLTDEQWASVEGALRRAEPATEAVLKEVEHLYSVAAANWCSLKRDFEEANRPNWIVLCEHGLKDLEALRQYAQTLAGEIVSQHMQMLELRNQRDRAMEAHVAALKVKAASPERPQSGEMVLWAWGPNGMVRAGEGSCGYIWYAAEAERGK